MVSALKVDGRRLHELRPRGHRGRARAAAGHGRTASTSPPPTPAGDLRHRGRVLAGTYVRTLAADLGQLLGGGAHLRNLRRTADRPLHDIDEAAPPDECELLDRWRRTAACRSSTSARRAAALRRRRCVLRRRRTGPGRGPCVAPATGLLPRCTSRSTTARPSRPSSLRPGHCRFTCTRVRARPSAVRDIGPLRTRSDVGDAVRMDTGAAASVAGRAGHHRSRPTAVGPLDRTVVTIGAYDGVHLGAPRPHRQTCGSLAARWAPVRRADLRPPPGDDRAPESAPQLLTDRSRSSSCWPRRASTLTLVIHFDVRSRPASRPTTSSRRVLVEALAVQGVVVGDDFHFGSTVGRATSELLDEPRRASSCVDPSTSCSAPMDRRADQQHGVRRPLAGGEARAECRPAMLGRQHEVRGVVVVATAAAACSASRRRTSECPTTSCLPGDGIYAGWYERPDGDRSTVRHQPRPAPDVLRGRRPLAARGPPPRLHRRPLRRAGQVRFGASCAASASPTASTESRAQLTNDVARRQLLWQLKPAATGQFCGDFGSLGATNSPQKLSSGVATSVEGGVDAGGSARRRRQCPPRTRSRSRHAERRGVIATSADPRRQVSAVTGPRPPLVNDRFVARHPRAFADASGSSLMRASDRLTLLSRARTRAPGRAGGRSCSATADTRRARRRRSQGAGARSTSPPRRVWATSSHWRDTTTTAVGRSPRPCRHRREHRSRTARTVSVGGGPAPRRTQPRRRRGQRQLLAAPPAVDEAEREGDAVAVEADPIAGPARPSPRQQWPTAERPQ